MYIFTLEEKSNLQGHAEGLGGVISPTYFLRIACLTYTWCKHLKSQVPHLILSLSSFVNLLFTLLYLIRFRNIMVALFRC